MVGIPDEGCAVVLEGRNPLENGAGQSARRLHVVVAGFEAPHAWHGITGEVSVVADAFLRYGELGEECVDGGGCDEVGLDREYRSERRLDYRFFAAEDLDECTLDTKGQLNRRPQQSIHSHRPSGHRPQ